ncbi:transposase [Pseudomonas sp. EA_65y_Pfl2_P78]|uniref:transposase n=1 Tax=Pseudomonas sp. EA_65y_Pfl2_P78 TaxID=3088695 RepID=UPI0030D77597
MTDENISPLQHTMRQLVDLSMREGYCDITFHNAPPLIGVRLSPTLNAALMYGAGAAKITELMDRVETRSGAVFRAVDVWVIVQFPDGLPTAEELANVDLAGGEAEVLPGKSMRLMAQQIYHCKNDVETEAMLRRVLAA